MAAKPDQRTTDTRDRVLKETQRLVATGGLKNVNLDHIAKTMSITRPALYHHFPGGKEQLIIDMIQEYTQEISRYYAEVLETHPDARNRLKAMLILAAREHFIDPGQLLYQAPMYFSAETNATLDNLFKPQLHQIYQVFYDGMKNGELRELDPDLLFFSFDGIFEKVEHIFSAPQFFAEMRLERFGGMDGLLDAFLDLWLKGTEPPDHA